MVGALITFDRRCWRISCSCSMFDCTRGHANSDDYVRCDAPRGLFLASRLSERKVACFVGNKRAPLVDFLPKRETSYFKIHVKLQGKLTLRTEKEEVNAIISFLVVPVVSMSSLCLFYLHFPNTPDTRFIPHKPKLKYKSKEQKDKPRSQAGSPYRQLLTAHTPNPPCWCPNAFSQ
jgi:hypothetical protein